MDARATRVWSRMLAWRISVTILIQPAGTRDEGRAVKRPGPVRPVGLSQAAMAA